MRCEIKSIEITIYDKEKDKIATVHVRYIRRSEKGIYTITDGETDHGNYLELNEVDILGLLIRDDNND